MSGKGTAVVVEVAWVNGLAAIRSLGRRGLRVLALDHRPYALGFRSRYAEPRLAPDPLEDEDGFVAALQVLAVVQKLRRPVSEVCHRFDPLPQILKNVRYRSGKPLDDAEVKSAIVDGENRLNGHGRLLVRSSGTESVIRVMGEGDDRLLVEEVVDNIVSALGQAAA